MKRLVSLAAMVLTLAMVLSLAACGNDDTNPDQATDSTQVQTGDTTDNNPVSYTHLTLPTKRIV